MTIATSLSSSSFYETLGNVGAAAFNSRYPDDYEYYLVALELYARDSFGHTNLVDSLIFPVTPSSISEGLSLKPNIKKTSGGIVSLTTDTFKPINISLAGTFGRKFKLMLDWGTNKNSDTKLLVDRFGNVKNAFSVLGSTGYGFTKKLENICWLSSQKDQQTQLPYLLKYTNLSWNTTYYVEVTDFTPHQSLDNNGIWMYQLNMVAVSPIGAGINDSFRKNLLVQSILSKSVQKAIYQSTNALATVIDNGIAKL